ncbi:hypothetical protein F4802DRAFT_563239 [Xylaria palmicola]|nr:hypothetical protein F4802DRAFT_563239 [Xylaria palmicola]
MMRTIDQKQTLAYCARLAKCDMHLPLRGATIRSRECLLPMSWWFAPCPVLSQGAFCARRPAPVQAKYLARLGQHAPRAPPPCQPTSLKFFALIFLRHIPPPSAPYVITPKTAPRAPTPWAGIYLRRHSEPLAARRRHSVEGSACSLPPNRAIVTVYESLLASIFDNFESDSVSVPKFAVNEQSWSSIILCICPEIKIERERKKNTRPG